MVLKSHVEDERAKWEEERERLRRDLDEAKKGHMQDKDKLNDLLAEVRSYVMDLLLFFKV